MSKNITIYTQETCAYCKQVKRFLDLKNKSYSEINLDEYPAERDKIIAKTGARTVPIVVVKDDESDIEKFAIGWNPSQLMAAVA
jgi:glutaredoxin 3